MDRQLQNARRLANMLFEQHDNAWRTAMAQRMQAEMAGYTSGEQTEYLTRWLCDNGVLVDLRTGTVDVLRKEIA
jgi:hypothetical protein